MAETASSEMDANVGKSSPPTDTTPQKRRKTDDEVNTSIFNPATSHSQGGNMSFDDDSASRTRLHQLQNSITDLFEASRQNLVDKVAAQKQELKSLRTELTEMRNSCEEEAAILFETDQEKEISRLIHEELELKKQAERDTLQLNAAKSRIIEMQQKVDSHASSQREINSNAAQLQEANEKITLLESEKEYLSQEIHDLRLRLERAGGLEGQRENVENILDVEVTSEELADGEAFSEEKLDQDRWDIGKRELREGNAKPSPKLSGKQLGSSCQRIATDNVPGNQKILVKGGSYVLPSHPKFFEIEWGKYYQRNGPGEYGCRKCRNVASTKPMIEDHIWMVHYEGAFKCPLCPFSTTSSLGRYAITQHIKTTKNH